MPSTYLHAPQFLRWKHVALLAALVAVALLEPLAVNTSEGVAIGVAVVTLLVYIVVLLGVFENRWEQHMSLFLIGSAFLASILH